MFAPGEKRASAEGLARLGAGSGPVGTGLTVSVAVRVRLLNVAGMVTLLVAVTETVPIVNAAVVAPAATVTLAGVEATADALLERETTAPPLGAALLRVTVPCEEL